MPVALIIYGAFSGLFEPSQQGYGALFFLGIIGLGMLSLILYAISRAVFKSNFRFQIISEAAIILTTIFIVYKRSGEKQFLLPSNYADYVAVVYGVDNSARLKKSIFTNKLKIKVPPNGIVLTSSKYNESYPRETFFDEKLGPIEDIFIDTIKRYEVPHGNDTINVRNKTYDLEVWFIKWEKNYHMINTARKDSFLNELRSILK